MKAPHSNEETPVLFELAVGQSDYEAVLALRHAAYLGTHKAGARLPVSAMADEFDAHSQIFVARLNGQIAASLCATLTENGGPTDHGRYTPYPTNFPELSQCIEASRLCVSAQYQGSGMLDAMMGHLVSFALSHERAYVYGGAAGHLIDVYARYGARAVGLGYRNQGLGGVEHRLILLDARELVLGQGVSEEIWLRAYSDISIHF
jgi:predicted GNAT family N-acyltransferase